MTAVRADEVAENDGGSIDELRQRWVQEAHAAGRDGEARVLEGHDDLADAETLERAAEDELLAVFRTDVQREFALARLHEETEGDDVYRGPGR